MKRLLFAPLLLTLITGCSFYDKTFQERRDDCADTIGGKRSVDYMFDKYKLGGIYKKKRNLKELPFELKDEILSKFCRFYLSAEFGEY